MLLLKPMWGGYFGHQLSHSAFKMCQTEPFWDQQTQTWLVFAPWIELLLPRTFCWSPKTCQTDVPVYFAILEISLWRFLRANFCFRKISITTSNWPKPSQPNGSQRLLWRIFLPAAKSPSPLVIDQNPFLWEICLPAAKSPSPLVIDQNQTSPMDPKGSCERFFCLLRNLQHH